MVKKEVTIINELGLHARAAAQVAKIAGNAEKNVWIRAGDKQVDAASVIDILTLACARGETITFMADTLEDMNILEELVELVTSGFGE